MAIAIGRIKKVWQDYEPRLKYGLALEGHEGYFNKYSGKCPYEEGTRVKIIYKSVNKKGKTWQNIQSIHKIINQLEDPEGELKTAEVKEKQALLTAIKDPELPDSITPHDRFIARCVAWKAVGAMSQTSRDPEQIFTLQRSIEFDILKALT